MRMRMKVCELGETKSWEFIERSVEKKLGPSQVTIHSAAVRSTRQPRYGGLLNFLVQCVLLLVLATSRGNKDLMCRRTLVCARASTGDAPVNPTSLRRTGC